MKYFFFYLGQGRVSNDILSTLTGFAEALLSLVFYCCNSRAVFRLSIGSLLVSNNYDVIQYNF